MNFYKALTRNLVILVVICLVILAAYPSVMSQMLQFSWVLLGPIAFLIVVAFAFRTDASGEMSLINRLRDTSGMDHQWSEEL